MKSNKILFYIINFLSTFSFTTGIWAFFFTTYHHFSLWQAIFILTISWIVSLFFEVPSWAWADRFGRKKMFLIWTLLNILDLVFWCFATSFISFIIAWVINWIWNAMISWNLEAIIHDNLEEEKNEKEFKNIASNSYIFIFLWRAISSAISWILFVISPLLPVYLTLISTISILLFAYFLKESKQIYSEHRDNLSHLKETWSFLVSHKNILIFMVILWTLCWLWNIYWYTQQPYFKILWFGIEFIWFTFTIWALFSALGTYIFKNISNKYSDKFIMNLMLFLVFLSSLFYGIFQKETAFMWLLFLSIMFWFITTFWNNFLIHKTPKTQKSTILSLFSFLMVIWYSLSNLVLSVVIDFSGLFNIYLINIFLIISLIAFNLFTFNKT